MKRIRLKDAAVYSAIISVGILLDQLTKWLAVKFLMPIPTKPIWEGVLHLTYVENRGAAFGMLANNRWIFLVFSAIAIVALSVYLFSGRAENMLYAISISMIISGGIGNMIDRLLLGYVVDFIDFRLINFAVFNGADSFVCVGAGLLVTALLKDLNSEMKKNRQDSKK